MKKRIYLELRNRTPSDVSCFTVLPTWEDILELKSLLESGLCCEVDRWTALDACARRQLDVLNEKFEVTLLTRGPRSQL